MEISGRPPGQKLEMISSLSVVDFAIYYIGDGLKSVILIKFPVGAGVRDFHHFENAIRLFPAVEFYIVDKSFVGALNRPFLVVGVDFVEFLEPFGEVETAIVFVQHNFHLIISFHLVIILYHTFSRLSMRFLQFHSKFAFSFQKCSHTLSPNYSHFFLLKYSNRRTGILLHSHTFLMRFHHC